MDPENEATQEIAGPHAGGRLTGAIEDYLASIHEHLSAALGSSEALTGFQPMMEWDLCTRGRLSEADIIQAYASATPLNILDDEELELPERFPDVTVDYLRDNLCVPVSWDNESVLLAVATPYSVGALAYQWQHMMGRKARFSFALRSHIERILDSTYAEQETDGLLEAGVDDIQAQINEAPIIRLVNDLFARSLEIGASDIHVEPAEHELAIRFRVDGVLHTEMTPPLANYQAIAGRIKLVGGLNIAERRLPQDGRTEHQVGRAKIDVRISTLPSIHGESIVMRILDKTALLLGLPELGFLSNDQDTFKEMIGLPDGIILVTGPTGSGKTTTLHACLNVINRPDKKILRWKILWNMKCLGLTR